MILIITVTVIITVSFIIIHNLQDYSSEGKGKADDSKDCSREAKATASSFFAVDLDYVLDAVCHHHCHHCCLHYHYQQLGQLTGALDLTTV